MKTWNRNLLCLSLILTLTSACGKKKNDDAVDAMGSIDDVTYVTESAANAMGSFADEASGEDESAQSKTSDGSEVQMAVTALCPRPAALSVCQTGVPSASESQKSATYQGCQIFWWSPVRATGNVSLAYNNLSCSLANSGDSVKRQYDMTFEGVYGGQLKVTSQPVTDYRGTTIGGGGVLKREVGGWSIQLLGRNERIIGAAGVERMNISLRTVPGQDIQLAGTLSRRDRTAVSGAFEVNHNKAEFTATFEPKNLHWNDTCCHPISGGFDVTYTGKIAGHGTVEYLSCGKAKITKVDGSVKEATLRACE